MEAVEETENEGEEKFNHIKHYEWGNSRKSYWRISKSPYCTKPLATLTVNMVKSVIYLIEPPYTEPYVRCCKRSGVSHSLLLDFI